MSTNEDNNLFKKASLVKIRAINKGEHTHFHAG